jgi:polar amino acid transport system substrate-binding protein
MVFRIKRIKSFLCFIALLTSICAWDLRAQEVYITGNEFPPYSYEASTGRISGYAVELAHEMIVRAGLSIETGDIQLLPWARAYRNLQTMNNAMILIVTRTEQRNDMFRWIGPIAPREIWLWKLKARADIFVSSLDEAKRYRVVAVRNTWAGKFLKDNGVQVNWTNSHKASLGMLFLDRADVIANPEPVMNWLLIETGRKMDNVDKLTVLDDKTNYYIAFNKNFPDSTFEQLENAFDSMQEDGTVRKLQKKYLIFVQPSPSLIDP